MTTLSDRDATSVTVLICTAHRAEVLDRAVSRLAAGAILPDEIVVVNGGDDQANRVVQDYSATFTKVTLLQYPNRNLAVSRNIGLPYCTSDIVAMTDDDAEVSVDWIQRLKKAHSTDQRAGAVGGPVIGSRAESLLNRIADRVVFPSFPERRTVRTLPGVNVSYKREVVDHVGEFDEALFRGEDVDFNWRVLELGYHIVYDPDVRVRHEHRRTVAGLLQQQYMYGRAYVLVRGKWHEMYCVYPHHLRTARNWMKLAHFAVAVIYQPALAARAMPSTPEALAAYPLLVAHHGVWKIGMLRQLVSERFALTAKSHYATGQRPLITLVRQWEDGSLREASQGVVSR